MYPCRWLCSAACPARGEEGPKQPPAALILLALRVPLDPQDKPAARKLDRLDHPVRGVGRGGEAARDLLDRLMVSAVDPEPSAAEDGVEPALRLDLDPVPGKACRQGGLMAKRAPALPRQILVERAAERHIEELHSSAHPQDRQIGLEGSLVDGLDGLRIEVGRSP